MKTCVEIFADNTPLAKTLAALFEVNDRQPLTRFGSDSVLYIFELEDIKRLIETAVESEVDEAKHFQDPDFQIQDIHGTYVDTAIYQLAGEEKMKALLQAAVDGKDTRDLQQKIVSTVYESILYLLIIYCKEDDPREANMLHVYIDTSVL